MLVVAVMPIAVAREQERSAVTVNTAPNLNFATMASTTPAVAAIPPVLELGPGVSVVMGSSVPSLKFAMMALQILAVPATTIAPALV